MREFPVFVPANGKKIAAIVTLPEGAPRGVVLFTTGGGGTLRSQRFRLWTRAARALAEIDVASVRMEFAGVGDSTGEAVMGFNDLPVADVVELARFAMEATGTTRLGMCGNCGGARTSLKAVDELPTCESMVLFWLKPLARTVKGKPLARLGSRIAQRLPGRVRSVAASVYFRAQDRSRRGNDVVDALRSIGASTDLLLVETRSKLGGMPRIVADLREPGHRRRVELREIESTSMQAFQSLEDQVETVEMVTAWFDLSFSREAPGEAEPDRGPDERTAQDFATRTS